MGITEYIYYVYFQDDPEGKRKEHFDTYDEAMDFIKKNPDADHLEQVEIHKNDYGEVDGIGKSEVLWDVDDDVADEPDSVDDNDVNITSDDFEDEDFMPNDRTQLNEQPADDDSCCEGASCKPDIDFSGMREAMEENEDTIECRKCGNTVGKNEAVYVPDEKGYVCKECWKSCKGELTEDSSEDTPAYNITHFLEIDDGDIIDYTDPSGIDYYYTILKSVHDAKKFNYHSDYWGSADYYQEVIVGLMENLENYVGKKVQIDTDDGPVIGILRGLAVDRQYNSPSHCYVIIDEDAVSDSAEESDEDPTERWPEPSEDVDWDDELK